MSSGTITIGNLVVFVLTTLGVTFYIIFSEPPNSTPAAVVIFFLCGLSCLLWYQTLIRLLQSRRSRSSRKSSTWESHGPSRGSTPVLSLGNDARGSLLGASSKRSSQRPAPPKPTPLFWVWIISGLLVHCITSCFLTSLAFFTFATKPLQVPVRQRSSRAKAMMRCISDVLQFCVFNLPLMGGLCCAVAGQISNTLHGYFAVWWVVWVLYCSGIASLSNQRTHWWRRIEFNTPKFKWTSMSNILSLLLLFLEFFQFFALSISPTTLPHTSAVVNFSLLIFPKRYERYRWAIVVALLVIWHVVSAATTYLALTRFRRIAGRLSHALFPLFTQHLFLAVFLGLLQWYDVARTLPADVILPLPPWDNSPAVNPFGAGGRAQIGGLVLRNPIIVRLTFLLAFAAPFNFMMTCYLGIFLERAQERAHSSVRISLRHDVFVAPIWMMLSFWMKMLLAIAWALFWENWVFRSLLVGGVVSILLAYNFKIRPLSIPWMNNLRSTLYLSILWTNIITIAASSSPFDIVPEYTSLTLIGIGCMVFILGYGFARYRHYRRAQSHTTTLSTIAAGADERQPYSHVDQKTDDYLCPVFFVWYGLSLCGNDEPKPPPQNVDRWWEQPSTHSHSPSGSKASQDGRGSRGSPAALAIVVPGTEALPGTSGGLSRLPSSNSHTAHSAASYTTN